MENIKESDLIVPKAEKNNTIAIMEKMEYIKKTEKFIKQGQYEVVKYKYIPGKN